MDHSFWSDWRVTSVIGFALGLLANKVTEYWTRGRSYLAARKLRGKWRAYNMADGRHIDPQPMHDKLTEIKPCPLYKALSTRSHVLEVNAEDPDGRTHSGPLVIDPVCPQFATRIVLYSGIDEISEQRIVISRDGKTLYVFPVHAVATLGPSAYSIHALRKK
jgi:hypothetical protein